MKFSKPTHAQQTIVPLIFIGIIIFLPIPKWVIGGLVGFWLGVFINNITE